MATHRWVALALLGILLFALIEWSLWRALGHDAGAADEFHSLASSHLRRAFQGSRPSHRR